MIAPEQWREIWLDLQAGHPELDGIDTGERFFPLRSAKGLASGEHFARYLFAAGYARDRRVLDIACGPGYGARLLKLAGAREVAGIDRDARTIEFARRRYGAPGVEFRCADGAEAAAGEPPFDLIVSFETLEHVEDPEAFLEGLKARLAPDGLLILSCPHDARSPWVSPFHLRHYTYQEFYELAARCFPDPLPVAQIHGIASLVLPLASARADDLAPHPLPETYFDVAKAVESSDAFLLLCGRRPVDPRPVAVITKNLTELLQEIYAAVNYLRERAPWLEAELGRVRSTAQQQERELFIRGRALEDQKTYTLELEDELEAMRYSRTWQLMQTCREALRSPAQMVRLPLRLARLLIDPPRRPLPPSAIPKPASALLPQYRPHRRSTIGDWPAELPLVSVGIPCYNYGRFLREAIDSVLASTFQDFEIIVVNDGSTDAETLAALASIRQTDRLRVVDQPNQGLAAARNKGAALARGKYVVSLDADDQIAATYLEKAVWVLEHHPQHAFCYSLVQMFDAETKLWKTQPFDLEKLLRNNHVATAAVFRREAWIEAGGFRDGLHGQDDWNFWITLGARGWMGHFLPEPLFLYRRHAASMWSQLDMEARERTADAVRSLHGYITGLGDSRAAEEFGRSQDPVVRAALDHPEPAPPAGLALAERPHLKFGDGRPALLFAIPWMAVGGAEQVVLQVMHGLAPQYGLAVVTTLEARPDWEPEFARITPWIYHLARLPLDDPTRYLQDLIRAHGISGLVISGSALAYQSLAALKTIPGLWTADIVHNTVAEGYLETSIKQDRHLDCHFAVGGPQQEALIRRGRVAPEKIRLASTSADAMARFHPSTYARRLPQIRHQLGLTGGEVVLSYTGRLAVEKDVPLFVRVVGQVVRAHPGRRFRAFILGDGPERARVEHEIRSQGLQGIVEILGFTDQVGEVLAVSRFAFLTSRFEGSSVTVLEAMSMRQIVIAADAGSIRDVIENGVNGFVVSSREPADFAACVSKALADPAGEAEMRERARRTILERFELAGMIRVYADAIAGALARRPSPA